LGAFTFKDMTQTKQCTKCKETKELTEFHKDVSKDDGAGSHCKSCKKAYRDANKEAKAEYDRRYCSKNKERRAERNKLYRQENSESISEKDKLRYQKNKVAKAARAKAYYQENKEVLRKHRTKYMRERRQNDPVFRLISNKRRHMHALLKGNSKSASTLEVLGCSVEYYVAHLEAQFTEGMHMGNYGEWHQDHIIPASVFDQTDPEQFAQCWHYSNFQPLWAEDNIRKSDTITNEHQTKLL
jgi:hypothetical protein